MGFWGWPIATSDAAWRACEAALAIRREFIARGESKSTSANELRVGIGIATGRAIAGKIGTSEQVKVTVLGPVVNVAARLEKLTRTVQAPILIDGPTATSVKDHSSDQSLRLRRVALMKPVGMSSIVDVHELLPTTTELPELTSDSLDRYAQAWAAFQKGEWRLAEQQLDAVDATDRVRQFLAEYVKRHANNPPDNWNGVIEF